MCLQTRERLKLVLGFIFMFFAVQGFKNSTETKQTNKNHINVLSFGFKVTTQTRSSEKWTTSENTKNIRGCLETWLTTVHFIFPSRVPLELKPLPE